MEKWMKRFEFDSYEQRMIPQSDGDWVRYSDVEALREVGPEMIVVAEQALQDFIDSLPKARRRFRVDAATKFRIRYQAMINFSMGE